MIERSEATYWAKVYLSSPIETAKQLLRADCLREGLCVTIEPTLFIYTGGEEAGYVVGLINYPRFPKSPQDILARARHVARVLLEGTYQQSALVMAPDVTEWMTTREDR